MKDCILPYLLSLPLPPEGPAREHLRTLQALAAAGCDVTPGLIARCWAEAAGGARGDALKYLRGARPWPSPGRKRGKLIRAVEEWERANAPEIIAGRPLLPRPPPPQASIPAAELAVLGFSCRNAAELLKTLEGA